MKRPFFHSHHAQARYRKGNFPKFDPLKVKVNLFGRRDENCFGILSNFRNINTRENEYLERVLEEFNSYFSVEFSDDYDYVVVERKDKQGLKDEIEQQAASLFGGRLSKNDVKKINQEAAKCKKGGSILIFDIDASPKKSSELTVYLDATAIVCNEDNIHLYFYSSKFVRRRRNCRGNEWRNERIGLGLVKKWLRLQFAFAYAASQ